MPPLFVEIPIVVSPSRLATALKGTGKGLPESPSVASLLLMRMPPLFVEKKSIMDEELIPHFSGQGHPKLRLGPSSAEDGKSSEIWYQTPPETFQHQTLAILFFD